MSHPPDLPGPGEHSAPNSAGEPSDRLVPHGDLSEFHSDCVDYEQAEHRGSVVPSVNQPDTDADAHRRDILRRTGTDQDGMRPVRATDDLPEHRLDRSAHDLQRETRFDPAQDNAGPQSDKS